MPKVKRQRSKPQPTRLLTLDEVAAHFGVSPSTIQRMVRLNEFPKPVRLGRRVVRWDVHTLNQFIAAGCKGSK